MRKEYHYTLSRTDRISLVLFIIVLLGWELMKGLFPGKKDEYVQIPRTKKEQKANSYSYAADKKFAYNKFPKNTYRAKFDRSRSLESDGMPVQPPSEPVILMTASVNELVSTGLNGRTANNIRKYIQAGGKIASAADLLKIYGMDTIQLSKAAPYLIFPGHTVHEQKPAMQDNKVTREKVLTDLNKATGAELEAMNGIGPVLAERIIKFREALGGFVETEQLKSVYGIQPELFEKIKGSIFVSGVPKKININTDTISKSYHPYLSKKMIRIIDAYKEHHGPLMNAEELKKVYPADTAWLKNILPYLSFEISAGR